MVNHMDNKKIVLIAAIILIAVGVVLLTFNNTGYERIELAPNGTSIDIPTNHMKYQGEMQGFKLWSWNYGALITYNNQTAGNGIQITGFSSDSLNELVKSNHSENIDGFTVYTLDGSNLLNSLKINVPGKIYCIYLTNETTSDYIVICCNDKDVTLHMAKSVEYKN